MKTEIIRTFVIISEHCILVAISYAAMHITKTNVSFLILAENAPSRLDEEYKHILISLM